MRHTRPFTVFNYRNSIGYKYKPISKHMYATSKFQHNDVMAVHAVTPHDLQCIHPEEIPVIVRNLRTRGARYAQTEKSPNMKTHSCELLLAKRLCTTLMEQILQIQIT